MSKKDIKKSEANGSKIDRATRIRGQRKNKRTLTQEEIEQ